MAVQKKLSNDIQWGATGAGTLSFGRVISCRKKKTVKQHEEPDEDGEVHSLVLYDQRQEVTLEVLAKLESSEPDVGTTLTVGGVVDLIVTEAETVWTRGDTVKYNVSAWKTVA